MWGIMCETENGKIFKIVKTLDEAKEKSIEISLNGYYEVTVYDYDKEKDEYIEFFKL